MSDSTAAVRVITGHYGAAVLFVIPDYLLEFNMRLMFLGAWPAWRGLYCGGCSGCFGPMLWKPVRSGDTGAAETLLSLPMPMIAMALRLIIGTDDRIEAGRGFVSPGDRLNFGISGSIAELALLRGISFTRRYFRQ